MQSTDFGFDLKRRIALRKLYVLFVFLAYVSGAMKVSSAIGDEVSLQAKVILDETRLRFPEPIYGFMHLVNASDSPQHVRAVPLFHGLRTVTFGTQSYNDGSIPPNAPFTLLGEPSPPGFHVTRYFQDCISDREILEQILQNGSGTILFSVYAQPKDVHPLSEPKSLQSLSGEVRSFSHEARGGFDLVSSPEVSIEYSLTEDIFRDDLKTGDRDGFSERLRVPELWRESRQRLGGSKGKESARFNVEEHVEVTSKSSLDLATQRRLPVLHVFPERIDELQAIIRCDTATWRTLEIRRLLLTQLTHLQTPEAQERLLSELIAVLRCCGLAEAYSNAAWISESLSPPGTRIVANGEGARPVRELWGERLAEAFPGYRFEGSSEQSAPLPDNQQDRLAYPKGKRLDYIDVNMPSPRQRAMKQWEDSGKVEPCPCPCEILSNSDPRAQ